MKELKTSRTKGEKIKSWGRGRKAAGKGKLIHVHLWMKSGCYGTLEKGEVISQMVLEDENTVCALLDYCMGQLKNECRTFSHLASSHPIMSTENKEHYVCLKWKNTLRTPETVLQPTKLE